MISIPHCYTAWTCHLALFETQPLCFTNAEADSCYQLPLIPLLHFQDASKTTASEYNPQHMVAGNIKTPNPSVCPLVWSIGF